MFSYREKSLSQAKCFIFLVPPYCYLYTVYMFKAHPVTLYFDRSTIDRESLGSLLDKARIEVLAVCLKYKCIYKCTCNERKRCEANSSSHEQFSTWICNVNSLARLVWFCIPSVNSCQHIGISTSNTSFSSIWICIIYFRGFLLQKTQDSALREGQPTENRVLEVKNGLMCLSHDQTVIYMGIWKLLWCHSPEIFQEISFYTCY